MASVPGLIIETDIFSDVDDVGALALAHHYADLGRAELLAVGVNTPSRYGHRAVRVVNDYFGRSVPVGAMYPMDDSVFDRDYAKYLSDHYGGPATEQAPDDAVAVHRRALSSAPDGSVTVVSLGFLHNLHRLLASGPDGASPSPGADLVSAKVNRLVVMGGRFPGGQEMNIATFPGNARETISGWPTPVQFVGWEVGAPVVTGRLLSTRGADDVIATAYRRYSGAGAGRESWDLIAVLLATEGPGEHLLLSEPGRVDVDDSGATRFVPDPGGRHTYAMLRSAPGTLAGHLDAILELAPARRPRGAQPELAQGTRGGAMPAP